MGASIYCKYRDISTKEAAPCDHSAVSSNGHFPPPIILGAKDVAVPKSRAGEWENKGALLVPDIQGYIASLLCTVEEGDSDLYRSLDELI